ncbi:MAG: protein kinase [Fuerstiella sp.]|nr:protein kinase [Fuerstiella sp.]
MAIPPTKISTCPPNKVLARLVSGSLHEDRAEEVFQHLEACDFCQNKVDELESRAKGVLASAGTTRKTVPDQPQLEKLIRRVQNLGASEGAAQSLPQEAVPVDSFVNGLRRCGLFPVEEVDSLLSDVQADDSSSMAKKLIKQRKLTPFQARVLLKGRWKGLVLGNYVLLKKLGQGGMGNVFKARHRRLGRVVCVKVMNSAGRKSPNMMERFKNEARTVAALSHPNFVVAHDADEAEGVPFLVMEYIEGSDLAKHVAAHGPLPVKQVLQLMSEAAEALQYAHDQGITHRDIKPHNLLLSEDADSDVVSIKILDMGLARFDSLLSDNPDVATHAAMTNTGVIMGTVDYMSPEQALRSRDADNRSDIYSLGCTLHYLLTGRPVFEGDTIMARLIAHREVPAPSLEQKCSGAMRGLDAVFHRMLAKKPDRRYQSMNEVAADIDALLTGRVPVAVEICPEAEGSILEQRRRRRRRPAYATWAGVLGTICLIGAGIWKSFPDQSKPTTQRAVQSGAGAASGNSETAMKSESGNGFAATGLAFPVNFGGGNRLLDGGDGRALAVLPVEQFDDGEYLELKRQLETQNIQLAVTTIRGEQPHPKHDENIQVGLPIRLTDVRADDFDMIFFVGGLTDEFQSKAATQTLEPLVNTAIGQGLVVAALSQSSLQAIVGVEFYSQCVPETDGDVTSGSPAGLDGYIVHAQSAVHTKALVRKAKQLCEETADGRKFGMSSGGRMATRSNGFPGRALVILPDQFEQAEFHAVVAGLGELAIGFEVASSRWGQIYSKDQTVSHIADRMLDEFVPRNYDFVFFVGGDTHAFSEVEASRRLQLMATRGLDAGLIFASCSASGRELMDITEVCAECTFEQVDQLTVGQPLGSSGAVVRAQSPKLMKSLVSMVITMRDEFLERRQKE